MNSKNWRKMEKERKGAREKEREKCWDQNIMRVMDEEQSPAHVKRKISTTTTKCGQNLFVKSRRRKKIVPRSLKSNNHSFSDVLIWSSATPIKNWPNYFLRLWPFLSFIFVSNLLLMSCSTVGSAPEPETRDQSHRLQFFAWTFSHMSMEMIQS